MMLTRQAAMKGYIVSLCESIRVADHEDIEAAFDAALDDLITGERSDDLFIESVLDGLRWGFRAGAAANLGGSTILRLMYPDGSRVTCEWIREAGQKQARHVIETVRAALGAPEIEK